MVPRSSLTSALEAARSGDIGAFRVLVEATEGMAYAVAWQVLRRESDARDAVQDAYLIAFRRLGDLTDPEAFPGWLRRIVVATALNHRRRSRVAWVPVDDATAPPVLDAEEAQWTHGQQRLLSRALLTLSRDERRLVELHYHGGWTVERLARADGAEPPTLRKRLQRIRDRLRPELALAPHDAMGRRAAEARRVRESLPARRRKPDAPRSLPSAGALRDRRPRRRRHLGVRGARSGRGRPRPSTLRSSNDADGVSHVLACMEPPATALSSGRRSSP
jgi:RNA polymerase sigma-70 factor (ECF subfamily)